MCCFMHFGRQHSPLLLMHRLSFFVACQQWTLFPSTVVVNGQLKPAATVQQCQTACISNFSCNGFDWIPTGPATQQCWLSGIWSGARSSSSGANHYDLNRNCAGKLRRSSAFHVSLELFMRFGCHNIHCSIATTNCYCFVCSMSAVDFTTEYELCQRSTKPCNDPRSVPGSVLCRSCV